MPPKKSRPRRPNRNPFRIELEEGKPTLVFFVKKPKPEDFRKVDEKLLITTTGDEVSYKVHGVPLDASGCVFSVEAHYPAERIAATALVAEAERVGRLTASAEGQAERVFGAPLEPELKSMTVKAFAFPAPAPREERVNIRIGEEDMARLEAHAAALGLLPGQAARLLVLKGLKESAP